MQQRRLGFFFESPSGYRLGHDPVVTDNAAPATILTIEDRVATITLNRPANRNALSTDLVEGLAVDLESAIADPAAHVIVITGAGTVFCAGADLKERRTVAASPDGDELPAFVRVFQRIQSCSKPVVAKLNGSALAGGLGLACACDIAVSSRRAMFGFTEVRIGVAPAIISVVCLPKLRGADAAELFLTGERITADEAVRVGLINHAVDDEALDAATDALVAKLLLGSPKALAASKELLRRVPAFADQEAAFRWTSALSSALFAGDEATEGMRAFAEKRPPAWVLPAN